MSQKELSRLEVIQRVKGKTLKQRQAAELLSITVRQVKRLCKAYQGSGAAGLISKRRGRSFYDESNAQVRQATRTYGAEGEVLSAGGSTEPVTNTYDALYRIKTLKDGNNNTTTYAYNSIELVSSITAPGSEVTQFTSYDNNGNLLQLIDGNNVTTTYVYNDSESFLTDIQYPATTSFNVHFTYDGYGRRSGMTDGSGSQSYSYGNLNELLSATTTYTGLSAKTISYTYYPDGTRESMTTPAGIAGRFFYKTVESSGRIY